MTWSRHLSSRALWRCIVGDRRTIPCGAAYGLLGAEPGGVPG